MAIDGLPQSTPSTPVDSPPKPKVHLLTMFRLGLFQMGLGIMSLLTLGVINRVMIDELKVPALMAAGAIAMYQFVAPARIWFGQMSDAKPLFGHHRSGYIWLGAIFFTILSFFALQVTWQLGISLQNTGLSSITYAWAALLAFVFALYGLALSASSTPFAALLFDVSDEDNRSKLVSIVWSMLMIGIVIGAIISSKILNRPEVCGADILSENTTQTTSVVNIAQLQSVINPLFILVPAIVFGLCLLSTVGVEKRFSRYASRSTVVEREDQITLARALRILTASRQTGLFFSFLLVMSISLFMQDAVLEPYGGEVFGMCISETTQLNAFFGMGTLAGIASTGFLITPRLGKKNTVKVGCIGTIICLSLFITAGVVADPQMLKGGLLLFGVASGVLTAGAIGLMLDLTAAETAGTFIGAWGLAQSMARGIATLMGGAVLDLGRTIFSVPVLAYSLVFAVQAVGMMIAISLLSRVNIREFQENAQKAIATVLESELD
ncbi:BCD family MFS transporter [Limnoraphis robusta]|uniref:BCD family MFS transporter n=1 Tax=Limnoraphis robusta CCNP1315 TaxID=3110306 RepID=A0ABU5TRU0_9CYAN|nr:BCD family MFS transporter [Limnoraphis robusta]MEA5517577.1 BCD family MFS transporter [Limnoraphis robusta CCNP1315]MEA5544621.1 BCD family MFS transporter [Limnoraphis robusta CCNP1324]